MVAIFNDHLLAPNVAAEVFHSPDGGKEGFLAVEELHLDAAQGLACIGDDLLVCVMPLCQSSTQALGRETCLKGEFFVLVWVGQARLQSRASPSFGRRIALVSLPTQMDCLYGGAL